MKPRRSPGEKICSHCHALFTCGPAQGEERCWCEYITHVPLIADEQTDCFCSRCLSEAIGKLNGTQSEPASAGDQHTSVPQLKEGEDYYVERGAMVFTAAYHLRRGNCCESGCRHCPYERKAVASTQKLPWGHWQAKGSK
jgi:hypothetical protein